MIIKSTFFLKITTTLCKTVVMLRKTSVELTCKWLATQMLVSLFARWKYICCTTIDVWWSFVCKYNHGWHLRLARQMSAYVALSITSTQSLPLRSATATRSFKIHSTRRTTKHVRLDSTGALDLKKSGQQWSFV